MHSDLIVTRVIEYLFYYRNPQMPKDLLEKEFMIAVDTVLNKARVNAAVYKHITSYLIDGFKKFGFEKCIEYILDNYVIKDDLCLDEESGSSVQMMIDQKKMLPIGADAPDVALHDTSGALVSLTSIHAEKILIVFWSSSCPHCQSMIPQLADLSRRLKNSSFRIMAISLDNNRAEWLNFVRVNKLSWINVNDPAGWAGNAALAYYLYATPSMFLLDHERKIIAKPITIEELQKEL
jgi:peroxiredoxin